MSLPKKKKANEENEKARKKSDNLERNQNNVSEEAEIGPQQPAQAQAALCTTNVETTDDESEIFSMNSVYMESLTGSPVIIKRPIDYFHNYNLLSTQLISVNSSVSVFLKAHQVTVSSSINASIETSSRKSTASIMPEHRTKYNSTTVAAYQILVSKFQDQGLLGIGI